MTWPRNIKSCSTVLTRICWMGLGCSDEPGNRKSRRKIRGLVEAGAVSSVTWSRVTFLSRWLAVMLAALALILGDAFLGWGP